jgi:hypothetical protein
MGQCGPTDPPCDRCRKMYEANPDYDPHPDKPGCFVWVNPKNRPQARRRRERRSGVLVGADRLPVALASKRQAQRRRSAKRARRS